MPRARPSGSDACRQNNVEPGWKPHEPALAEGIVRVSVMARGLLAGVHVLVVEDEALLGWELTGLLEDEGAEVVGPVVTVAHALACLADAQGGIDAAVLDWRLTDGVAQPVADRLLDMAIPFLFFTGDDVALRKKWPGACIVSKLKARSIVPTLVDVLSKGSAPDSCADAS
jgi:CheY-like chemotaxis protein